MLLKSIEINGFKSFAKKSDLTFTSKISAIVGPNGSGKSNVAEAFRFVLGEQSIKSLRGKRGEDLIWNGSNEVPRLGKASVKLIFDNRNKFLPLDFEEVSIERTVHRDGVNEYFLNGSRVRLKDITELLFSAHIGSSGHHIISQGEADRILNSSVSERKEIVEEALGLKIYQYKKIESQKKLFKTKENIKQIESLKREIAPHLKFLKKQVEKIEKAEEIRKELVLRARKYLFLEGSFLKKERDRIENVKGPIVSHLDTIRKEIVEAKKLLENRTSSGSLGDLLLKLEDKLTDVRKRKDGVWRVIGEVDGEISSISKMIKKHEDFSKNNEWKTVELRAVKELYKEVDGHILNIEKSKDEFEIRKSIETIRNIINAFIEMHEDRVDTQVLIESKLELEKLILKKEEVLKEKNTLELEEGNFLIEYNNLKKRIDDEKDINRDAEKTLFRAMADEQSVISKIKEFELEEGILKIKEDNFKNDSRELVSMLGAELSGFKSDDFLESVCDNAKQEDERRVIEKLKIRFEESGALGGGDVIKEYNESKDRDEFLARELLDLENSANSLQDLISDLDLRLSSEFEKGLNKINEQFKKFFILMFGGGEASLFVTAKNQNKKTESLIQIDESGDEMKEEDVNDVGIDIDVSLPRKKVKGLIQLSGGERALTSIALLFAISQVNPPPFIILDETDAALDEANSKKYGDMIENLSKFSQLIVITHNRETMSRAGVLYGITMGQGGVSKMLSVAFEDAVAVAK